MRFAALAISVLCLAACQQDPPAQGARDTSTPALTIEGYGPIRVGMTVDEVRAATHLPLEFSAESDPNACAEQLVPVDGGDQLVIMFEESKVTRITAGAIAPHVRTAQNVGVGSTDAEVRAAYQNLIEEPAKYAGPPAHDLIAWTTPNQTGIRFEVEGDGKVGTVHAGGASINYMEGCS